MSASENNKHEDDTWTPVSSSQSSNFVTSKQAILAQAIFSQTVHCSRVHRGCFSRWFVQFVSHDLYLSEAVWRTILRGSTISSSAVAAVSTQRVSRRRSQSEEGERQGSRPSTCWQRFWEGVGFQHCSTDRASRCRSQVSIFVSESGRTGWSSSNSSDEARSRHPSCRRGRSCSNGIEGGFAESPRPSTVAAGPRPDESHRGIFEPVPEDVEDHDVRSTEIKRGHHRIGVQKPAFSRLHLSLRQILRRRSVSFEGCQWCQGWVVEATENVGQFVSRVGAFGLSNTRWGVDGESHPSSRRVHEERMSIFKVPRDAQYGLRGVRVGEASNPGPHNLVFRRTRRANTVPPTVVDLTSAEVESNVPATHPLTEVDGTESAASSGFLNKGI